MRINPIGLQREQEARAVKRGADWLKARHADLLICGEVVRSNRTIKLWFIDATGRSSFGKEPYEIQRGQLVDEFSTTVKVMLAKFMMSSVEHLTIDGIELFSQILPYAEYHKWLYQSLRTSTSAPDFYLLLAKLENTSSACSEFLSVYQKLRMLQVLGRVSLFIAMGEDSWEMAMRARQNYKAALEELGARERAFELWQDLQYEHACSLLHVSATADNIEEGKAAIELFRQTRSQWNESWETNFDIYRGEVLAGTIASLRGRPSSDESAKCEFMLGEALRQIGQKYQDESLVSESVQVFRGLVQKATQGQISLATEYEEAEAWAGLGHALITRWGHNDCEWQETYSEAQRAFKSAVELLKNAATHDGKHAKKLAGKIQSYLYTATLEETREREKDKDAKVKEYFDRWSTACVVMLGRWTVYRHWVNEAEAKIQRNRSAEVHSSLMEHTAPSIKALIER
jgi:hypothetical protein